LAHDFVIWVWAHGFPSRWDVGQIHFAWRGPWAQVLRRGRGGRLRSLRSLRLPPLGKDFFPSLHLFQIFFPDHPNTNQGDTMYVPFPTL
jgi:hypothetical protein